MLANQAIAYQVVLGLAAVLVVATAAFDLRRFRVPNALCAALVALFPIYVWIAPSEVDWGANLVVSAIVLAIGFALFARNLVGAGDAKFIAAISLWAGPAWIGLFLLVMGIAGGLQALGMAALAYRRQKVPGLKGLFALGKVQVPYGVAIALGGLCTLAMLVQPVSPFPGS